MLFSCYSNLQSIEIPESVQIHSDEYFRNYSSLPSLPFHNMINSLSGSKRIINEEKNNQIQQF
jgi:hypothetical protein